jgi:hypothetical protein
MQYGSIFRKGSSVTMAYFLFSVISPPSTSIWIFPSRRRLGPVRSRRRRRGHPAQPAHRRGIAGHPSS